jgi:TetR/AcrR family transcriptional regulator, mexJK operon transcriptional repressor
MSSVRPDTGIKEAIRHRELAERREDIAPRKGVAGIVRSFSADRAKPKAKEQEVLEVATAYFLKHGYQGASINAMARSSGISKESIYRYFSSKKQLFEAVIARELVEYQTKVENILAAVNTMDLREALVGIGETVLGVITLERSLALRRLVFEEARRSPDVGQHYYKIGPEEAFGAIERVFAVHGIKSDIPPTTLSRHFLALISWRVMLERECAVIEAPTKAETRKHVESIVDDFMSTFLRSR